MTYPTPPRSPHNGTRAGQPESPWSSRHTRPVYCAPTAPPTTCTRRSSPRARAAAPAKAQAQGLRPARPLLPGQPRPSPRVYRDSAREAHAEADHDAPVNRSMPRCTRGLSRVRPGRRRRPGWRTTGYPAPRSPRPWPARRAAQGATGEDCGNRATKNTANFGWTRWSAGPNATQPGGAAPPGCRRIVGTTVQQRAQADHDQHRSTG